MTAIIHNDLDDRFLIFAILFSSLYDSVDLTADILKTNIAAGSNRRLYYWIRLCGSFPWVLHR